MKRIKGQQVVYNLKADRCFMGFHRAQTEAGRFITVRTINGMR